MEGIIQYIKIIKGFCLLTPIIVKENFSEVEALESDFEDKAAGVQVDIGLEGLSVGQPCQGEGDVSAGIQPHAVILNGVVHMFGQFLILDCWQSDVESKNGAFCQI